MEVHERVGATSKVKINRTFGIVVKKQCNFLEFDLVGNEATKLRELHNELRFPSVIRQGKKKLVMRYLGEPVTRGNLPGSWREQLGEVARKLKEAGIIHRDIRPENFLIWNGWLCLIDFGWAIFNNETPWGPCDTLGDKYRNPNKHPDDDYAFAKVREAWTKLSV